MLLIYQQRQSHSTVSTLWRLLGVVALFSLVSPGLCMRKAERESLRSQVSSLFWHGFNSYLAWGYPEDEVRPLSCQPLSRDPGYESHPEVNDVFGNYSLTLIDSLSTLAILASSGDEEHRTKSLNEFQDGISSFVANFGDGTSGEGGQGLRARGFDLDSKVQVFETTIRGLGGLLSAHQFAVGDLPITGYRPCSKADCGEVLKTWSNGFTYDGQLLRLAHDLGRRLLPAFRTKTGIPYPRVNLRHGIPFYPNAIYDPYTVPLGQEGRESCPAGAGLQPDFTDTCAAGSGSLLLELTVLSRLTGDPVFEEKGKRAFWAIWERRSQVGLVPMGIDAESGYWTNMLTGIGAGVDSFFEYAVKAYILLSNTDVPSGLDYNSTKDYQGPPLLEPWQHDPLSYWYVWKEAKDSIHRHLRRDSSHSFPHYIQGDLATGAPRALWFDALSAFFSGVLALAGDVEDGIQANLLFVTLWDRYSGTPERWSSLTANIENGMGWWVGRPEFIESVWYLYRATKDPFYLHVGEMVLKDIQRRCWSECGWAGIEDVRTGERKDRMESFFLGELAKYMLLLFDGAHPLNHLESNWVFTTEGHPLILPPRAHKFQTTKSTNNAKADPVVASATAVESYIVATFHPTCPRSDEPLAFEGSPMISRSDYGHATALMRLHQMPYGGASGGSNLDYAYDHASLRYVNSPNSFTFTPWTLPPDLIPENGTCQRMQVKPMFDITFPVINSQPAQGSWVERAEGGIFLKTMSGLRFILVRDVEPSLPFENFETSWRIIGANNILLGRDEKIFVTKETSETFLSQGLPSFMKVRDESLFDIVFDVSEPQPPLLDQILKDEGSLLDLDKDDWNLDVDGLSKKIAEGIDQVELLSSAFQELTKRFQELQSISTSPPTPFPDLLGTTKKKPRTRTKKVRRLFPASQAVGMGAAPLPTVPEARLAIPQNQEPSKLVWNTIYMGDYNCDEVLPASVVKNHKVLILKRGKCPFADKLERIPAYVPTTTSLQLVLVVAFADEHVDGSGIAAPPNEDGASNEKPGFIPSFNPLVDRKQTLLSGIPRRNPIPMAMVTGGQEMWDMLSKATSLGMKRRYRVESNGVLVDNFYIV